MLQCSEMTYVVHFSLRETFEIQNSTWLQFTHILLTATCRYLQNVNNTGHCCREDRRDTLLPNKPRQYSSNQLVDQGVRYLPASYKETMRHSEALDMRR